MAARSPITTPIAARALRFCAGLCAALSTALSGCAPVTEPVGRACHPFLVPDAGAALPRIECTADPQCPPPLVCTPPEEPENVDGPATCAVDLFGSEPDLLVETLGRARLPLDLIELPDNDGLLVQWRPPSDAERIRCVVTGCPWTETLVRGGFERCVIVDVLRDVDLGDAFTITPRVQSRSTELDPRARLQTCAVGEVDLRYTATELNLACWAFSETELVAVSSIHRIGPDQLGRHRDRIIATDCAWPPPATGAACVGAGAALGVCVGPRCCTPCSKDAQCGGARGSCRPLPSDGRSGSDPLPGPYLGYCADSCAGGAGAGDAGAADGGGPDSGVPDAATDAADAGGLP